MHFNYRSCCRHANASEKRSFPFVFGVVGVREMKAKSTFACHGILLSQIMNISNRMESCLSFHEILDM